MAAPVRRENWCENLHRRTFFHPARKNVCGGGFKRRFKAVSLHFNIQHERAGQAQAVRAYDP